MAYAFIEFSLSGKTCPPDVIRPRIPIAFICPYQNMRRMDTMCLRSMARFVGYASVRCGRATLHSTSQVGHISFLVLLIRLRKRSNVYMYKVWGDPSVRSASLTRCGVPVQPALMARRTRGCVFLNYPFHAISCFLHHDLSDFNLLKSGSGTQTCCVNEEVGEMKTTGLGEYRNCRFIGLIRFNSQEGNGEDCRDVAFVREFLYWYIFM